MRDNENNVQQAFDNSYMEDYQYQPPQIEENINWNAKEFVSHEKGILWYVVIFAASLIAAATLYIITKDITSPIVILILAAAIAKLGSKKPDTLSYTIDSEGISVGPKKYLFDDFRSFSVIEDTHGETVLLIPIRRLMIPVTLVFQHNEAEKVINALSNFLPFEPRKQDIADRISKKLKF